MLIEARCDCVIGLFLWIYVTFQAFKETPLDVFSML